MVSVKKSRTFDVKLLIAVIFCVPCYVNLAESDLVPVVDTPNGQLALGRLLQKDFWRSFFHLTLAVTIGLVVAFLAGKFSLDRPWDWGKAFTCLGGFLAAWATWFALADSHGSWKSSRPDERVRSLIFKMLFYPGIILAIIGGVW